MTSNAASTSTEQTLYLASPAASEFIDSSITRLAVIYTARFHVRRRLRADRGVARWIWSTASIRRGAISMTRSRCRLESLPLHGQSSRLVARGIASPRLGPRWVDCVGPLYWSAMGRNDNTDRRMQMRRLVVLPQVTFYKWG